MWFVREEDVLKNVVDGISGVKHSNNCGLIILVVYFESLILYFRTAVLKQCK